MISNINQKLSLQKKKKVVTATITLTKITTNLHKGSQKKKKGNHLVKQENRSSHALHLLSTYYAPGFSLNLLCEKHEK